MPEKQKSAQKKRDHKQSQGSARGAKPTYLTELQKILIANGGMAHRTLRQGKSRLAERGGRRPMTAKQRRDQEAA